MRLLNPSSPTSTNAGGVPSPRLLLKSTSTRLTGVGSAFPASRFTQNEVKKIFSLQNRVVNKLMDSGHVQTRHLYLPKLDAETGILLNESPAELNAKFRAGILDIGVEAARRALRSAGREAFEINLLVAVTSTGFLVPGVSSILARALGMRQDLQRLDVVGMGCNAGMSALHSAHQAAKSREGLRALIVCCEVNSASYVKDETVRTGIVNSLFGDGATAVVVENERSEAGRKESAAHRSLNLFDFECFTIAEQAGAMRFDLDESQGKQSFFLSKDIPFVIGDNMHKPVDALLARHDLSRAHIHHWVIHTGGGAVIDGAKRSLGLDEEQVRHTRSVLRDYGNISSGSVFASLERFQAEGSMHAGDLVVLIAMGPGATIEAGLGRVGEQ